ncbi:MCM DNA helicase complex subunit [Nowakowskiella sp. JEL0078]|nr:MCM DNA helicase complex subunit [Nowakowskiella sp. JEL0078]
MSKRSRAQTRQPRTPPPAPSSPIHEQEVLPPFSDQNDYDLIEEDEILMNDPLDDEEDDEGEDLFGPNIERDYRANEQLDQYDTQDLDEQNYDDLDADARQIAEAKMRRRDREQARQEGRLAAAFMDDGLCLHVYEIPKFVIYQFKNLDADEDEFNRPYQVRRRHIFEGDMEMEYDLENEEAAALPAEMLRDIRGPLNEWLALDGPRATIKREFQNFLTSYTDEKGHSVYGERIRAMCEGILEISYLHLQQSKAILAYYIANSPAEILKIFDIVAFEVVLSGFEEYDRIKNEIHVRISDIPSHDTLRDLRQQQLNTLIRVPGVVTRRTGVFPQLKYVKYDCVKCGAVLGPYYQEATSEIKIGNCPDCQSKGPFNVNAEQTIYRNFQKITLQESPGSVPAGRLPRHKEVILLWDLVDSVRPGEEIEITGIFRNNFDMSLNMKNGFPVFSTIIEANHVSKKQDNFASLRLTEDDVRQIQELSRDERIRERIIKSIAPSIYGHDDIKTALILAMFGGVHKNPQGKHRIRGDINVLLLGDPGTAKSQFLKYVEKTSHRAVYTTGQGASAVGLTASVHKDQITKEWTLEGGALVMADRGVCLIDEFDKMNDKDRTSIHEAMEQQSISISKAGIVTTLQARCAVIAAANPVRGRYNASIPFSQNVELTEPILSRFDILCVVQDTADEVADERLAAFVVNSHQKSHPDFNLSGMEEITDPTLVEQDPDIIPQDLLRKYIMYAKDRIVPKIAEIDQDKLASLYSELRRESLIGGSIPITVRHIESLVRMAEAFARMQLREIVRQDDIEHSMAVMIRSFVSAQKNSVRKQLERSFSKYMRLDRDNFELLNHLLSQMVKVHQRLNFRATRMAAIVIDCEDFEAKARDMSIHDLRSFYESPIFRRSFIYNSRERTITKV